MVSPQFARRLLSSGRANEHSAKAKRNTRSSDIQPAASTRSFIERPSPGFEIFLLLREIPFHS